MDLKELRTNLDSVDKQILELLLKRKEIVLQVVEYKKQEKLPLKQPEREKQLFEERKAIAKGLGLDENFVESLFRLIVEDSLNTQNLHH